MTNGQLNEMFDSQPLEVEPHCGFCDAPIADSQSRCEKCAQYIKLARLEEEKQKLYEERQDKLYWQIRLDSFLSFRVFTKWWWSYAFEFLTGDLPAYLLKRMRR